MNLTELDHALRKFRLSGMADVLDARLRHAQAEQLAPHAFIATLVGDKLQRRQDRLLWSPVEMAGFEVSINGRI
jgi:hypothetical protein